MTTPKYIALLSIEPNSSTATIIQEIRHMGHQPLVITSRDKMCKLKDKCLEHCIDVPEIVAISSLHNGNQSVEELVTAMGSYPIIDWINGNDQVTPLYLATIKKLGINFPFLEAYTNTRIKALARKILKDNGLSNIEPIVVRIDDQYSSFILKTPFVAKPITGAGSKFVKSISCESEWNDYREAYISNRTQIINLGEYKTFGDRSFIDGQDILIEPLLEGNEIEIDGFVANDHVSVCAIGHKIHRETASGFREIGCFMWYPDCTELDLKIKNWCASVLKEVSFSDGTFHIEAMLLTSGEIELIEINPRPGGGTVKEMVRLLSGVDLAKLTPPLWIKSLKNPLMYPTPQQTKSILCMIEYAWHDSEVVSIREHSEMNVHLPEYGMHKVKWYPQVDKDKIVYVKDGEIYLGEMLIFGLNASPKDVEKIIKTIRPWFDGLEYTKLRPLYDSNTSIERV